MGNKKTPFPPDEGTGSTQRQSMPQRNESEKTIPAVCSLFKCNDTRFMLKNTTSESNYTGPVDLLMEAYFVHLDKWAEHSRKSRQLSGELERIKTELLESLAHANAEMAEATRLQRLAHGRGRA